MPLPTGAYTHRPNTDVTSPVRLLLSLCGLLLAAALVAQTPNLKLLSWNIQHLGGSKTDEEIELMARILREYDVIAIQEVVAKDPAGAKAVARLAAALDRTGADYDFRVSDSTMGSGPHVSERYAFLWRTSVVSLRGRPRLLREYDATVDREPYLASFLWDGKPFRVVNLHTRPHDHEPEREIASLRKLMDDYADAPLFFVGDFNVPTRHTVFNPWLKRGWQQATHSKTTLRTKLGPDGDAYAHDIDNILVPTHQVNLREGGCLDLVAYFRGDLARARALSDHVPVYAIIEDF